jgi:hypothetical protein
MSNRARRIQRAQRAAAREARRGSGLSLGWSIAGLAIGTLVALTVAANAKDVKRYIKISSM